MSRASMRRRFVGPGIGLLLVLQASPFASAFDKDGRGPASRGRMSRSLAETAQHAGASNELVDVIVTFQPGAREAAKGLGAKHGGRAKGSLGRLPFQAMQVPAGSLDALASNPSVRFVSPDSLVFSASPAARETARVPGSATAQDTANAPVRGTGVTVAVVDTGVYPHGDFHQIIGQRDFVRGADGVATPPFDPYGHGTHVAGMIGGDGRNSYLAKYQGAATQARVLSLRALDLRGQGSLSDVLRALDWLLTTGIQKHNVRVLNLSMGKSVDEAQALDPLVLAVEAIWDAGVVVVVSAGNHGNDGHYTVTSPGNSRKVITVGSLTDNGTGTDFTDDYASTFSSRGPTLHDKVLKPDLVAPGNKVISPHAKYAQLGSLLGKGKTVCGFQGNGCSERYLELSGTSMAASVVSGAVARMLQKDPGLSPATVKARLMQTARKIPGDPTTVGAGVLNVDDAMNATGTVAGQALSPLMDLSADGSTVYVQDTALLWGGDQWAAGSLWPDAYLWSDAAGGFLSSQGSLWPDSYLWADAYLWSNGFLWSETIGPVSSDIQDP
jgi:serine protease AprX